MNDTRVLAIVLTYCAPESLDQCVGGIAAQTRPPDALLVVDNTGPPLTPAAPQEPAGLTTRVLRTGQNLGPAGGHARGLTEFLEGDEWTHAWVMDDDCVPDERALAALVEEARVLPDAHVVFPIRMDGWRRRVDNPPAWCGFLISREAVKRAGLPREELFWWAEDTEYLQFRMPRAGVKVLRTPSAVVWHWPIRRSGARPPWQYYYGARNTTWYRLHVQRTPDAYRHWLVTVLKLGGMALTTPPRSRHVIALVRGLADGLRGRLGHTMLPPPPPVADGHPE